MSSPWMPFYVADYMADTAHLSTVEHGAYLLLIMTYWRQGNLPEDDTRLARIARLPLGEWLNVRSTIVQFFGDGWSHKRIDAEIIRADEKSRKASLAGKRSSETRNRSQYSTDVEQTFDGRSTDVQLLQSQSQPLEVRDAIASLPVANATPTALLKFERDRKKLIEARAKLHLLGNDWNALAADCGLRQIEEIETGSKRERAALARLKEGRDFARIFTKIRASPRLRGANKSGWMVDFNWILIPDNIVKILEGNYDEIPKDQQRPKQQYYAAR